MRSTAKKTSRFRTNFEKPFEEFIRTHYSEHFRRISGARRKAKSGLFTYPLSGLMLLGLPMGALSLGANWLYQFNPEWFSNVVPAETQQIVLPVLYVATAAAAFIGMISGVSLGISHANRLVFEAEKNELQVRQVYFLRKLARKSKARRSHMANLSVSPRAGGSRGAMGNSSPGNGHGGHMGHSDFSEPTGQGSPGMGQGRVAAATTSGVSRRITAAPARPGDFENEPGL